MGGIFDALSGVANFVASAGQAVGKAVVGAVESVFTPAPAPPKLEMPRDELAMSYMSKPSSDLVIANFPDRDDLVNNNAGGLVSNNAGSLVNNNAGGLVNNNAGGLAPVGGLPELSELLRSLREPPRP